MEKLEKKSKNKSEKLFNLFDAIIIVQIKIFDTKLQSAVKKYIKCEIKLLDMRDDE